ncbi:uncharacterized protein [Mycetomoellerius zeteki]|uniref:uncharacterized protein n=1 Tax=Mycetomoellerius zeteki TaxID=64791 RepID=UPI00084EC617|nr:PREDICTED: uncharacterized protein LOC108722575 [Trachymyrmex zeteki]
MVVSLATQSREVDVYHFADVQQKFIEFLSISYDRLNSSMSSTTNGQLTLVNSHDCLPQISIQLRVSFPTTSPFTNRNAWLIIIIRLLQTDMLRQLRDFTSSLAQKVAGVETPSSLERKTGAT